MGYIRRKEVIMEYNLGSDWLIGRVQVAIRLADDTGSIPAGRTDCLQSLCIVDMYTRACVPGYGPMCQAPGPNRCKQTHIIYCG